MLSCLFARLLEACSHCQIPILRGVKICLQHNCARVANHRFTEKGVILKFFGSLRVIDQYVSHPRLTGLHQHPNPLAVISQASISLRVEPGQLIWLIRYR